MDNEKVKFISDKLKNKVDYNKLPNFLYKYSPFDNYTFDMLKNNYVYLCKVSQLDDKTECNATIIDKDLIDINTYGVTKKCVVELLESLKPYTSQENYEKAKNMILSIMNQNGTIKSNFLLDYSFDIQQLFPNINIFPIINYLRNIPEIFNDKNLREALHDLLIGAKYAKEKFGVCSLCENEDNIQMWEKYAQNEESYCIEYDIANYKYKDLLYPVIYTDDRKTNILNQLVKDFINKCICGFSNNIIDADISNYFRLFTTKNIKWNYQNEWRIIGNANEKLMTPKIIKIILGKNVSFDNKEKIKQYCLNNNIILNYR